MGRGGEIKRSSDGGGVAAQGVSTKGVRIIVGRYLSDYSIRL